MFENCKNSKKQGDLGLGLAIAYFVKLGYTVCLPLTDSQPYDLIVELSGKLQRVQVKTTGCKLKHKWYQVNLRTMGGNQRKYWAKKFDNSQVELLFIITEAGSSYLIPTDECQATTSIVLYDSYNKYLVV